MSKVKQLLHYLSRHRILTAAIAAVLFGGTSLAASAGLRQTLDQGWHSVVAWTGLADAGSESGKTFWCPMHPQIKSNKPNAVCPICNMALVELEGSAVANPKDLALMPQQVQQAGVATEPVRRRDLYRAIDTTGRLDYDETRRVGISSWVTGKARIEKLHVNFTGQRVEKGQLMAEIYSPELITAQEEYLVALKSVDRSRGTRNGNNRLNLPDLSIDLVKSARQKLLYQGLKSQQIDLLAKTRKMVEFVPISAPVSGTVIERHVQKGQYVSEGDWLFHLADLSRLWLFVDIYEEELRSVALGTRVELTVQAFPGETFVGTTTFIDRKVDPATRTVRVRIDVDNHDRRLLAGMYARAVVREKIPSALAVPENAVLWSGKSTVVIVKSGKGTFEPREVQLGKKWLYEYVALRDGGRKSPASAFGRRQQRYHEVLYGLYPGDEVVTAGAFLLNAESQFRNVLVKMLPPEDQRASLSEVVGRPISRRIEAVLDAYFELSATLAEDRIQQVDRRLAALQQATESLTKAAVEEKARKLSKDAERFHRLTVKLADKPVAGPKDARTRFGRISHDLTRLLVENGGKTLFGKSLFQFECGMAKVGYERWLWRTPQIHNPYMGQKMLKCGKRLEGLEP